LPEWLPFEGDIKELFDVAIIPNIRCPRGLGPSSPELPEVMEGEDMPEVMGLPNSRETVVDKTHDC